jgi:hypothetical protein
MDGIALTPSELQALTNGLTQPAAQLKALHGMGFVRAHRPRGGAVVLTRAHYLAVEEGRANTAGEQAQNETAGPNIVGLQQWAAGRAKRGQKAQGR